MRLPDEEGRRVHRTAQDDYILSLLARQFEHGVPLSQRIFLDRQASHYILLLVYGQCESPKGNLDTARWNLDPSVATSILSLSMLTVFGMHAQRNSGCEESEKR
jgi:hypothetical protein